MGKRHSSIETNLRELKINLSRFIRKVAAGETVTVCIGNRPVARIVPIARCDSLEKIAHMPGIIWSGGKPAGMLKVEVLPPSKILSELVAEDRR